MAFYCDYIFPLLNGRADPGIVRKARKATISKAQGNVVEIGFGTGKTLPSYSDAVSSLTIVEPSSGMNRRTIKALSRTGFPVYHCEQTAEKLPFPDNYFQTAVTTKTLCSVGDVKAVLAELYRVLKPGGQLLFLEHVKSKEERIAKWQRRLNPLQRKIGCGCNLDRDIQSAISSSGFQFLKIKRFEGGPEHPGTRFQPIIAGQAVRSN